VDHAGFRFGELSEPHMLNIESWFRAQSSRYMVCHTDKTFPENFVRIYSRYSRLRISSAGYMGVQLPLSDNRSESFVLEI